jgi:hypothetical protein
MVFYNFLLMVKGLGHALCEEFPSLRPLDLFHVFSFSTLIHPWFALNICPFGLLGYSFRELLFVNTLVTWGFGSLILFGIEHPSLNDTLTFGGLATLFGWWCSGVSLMLWFHGFYEIKTAHSSQGLAMMFCYVHYSHGLQKAQEI